MGRRKGREKKEQNNRLPVLGKKLILAFQVQVLGENKGGREGGKLQGWNVQGGPTIFGAASGGPVDPACLKTDPVAGGGGGDRSEGEWSLG